MNKIAVIIPYYGRLPVYFPFFLKSLKGRCFDVLFITDLAVPFDSPDNFIHIKMSFQDIKERVKNDFWGNDCGIFSEIDQYSHKKLCDLKPMYGYLFQDILEKYNYEYWGFGDCDLIYGRNLDGFIEDKIKNGYDVISLCKHWISGSFCLIKNSLQCRDLFKHSRDYRKIISSRTHYAFDECGYWHGELASGKMSLIESCQNFEHFTYVCETAANAKEMLYFHEDIVKESLLPNEIICYDSGKLSVSNPKSCTEIPLFHYIIVKQRSYFFFSNWNIIPDCFYIDNMGFYSPFMMKFRKVFRIFRWCNGACKALKRRLS